MCPHLGEDEDREPDRVGPKIVAGFAVAGAGIRLGPEAALALGAASPLFESLAERAWQELRPDARQRAALVLSTAARQAQHQPLDTRGCWRAAGAAPPAGCRTSSPLACGARSGASLASRGTLRPSAGVTQSVPARRTKRGPLARTAPGQPAGAALRSRAGAPAFRPLSPGRRGTVRRLGRVSARSARRRS